jgi:hypothetical protein
MGGGIIEHLRMRWFHVVGGVETSRVEERRKVEGYMLLAF